MSQPGHRKLEHLPLGRIRQRVLSQFWLGFAGPWDILRQKQAVCLWGQSCEGLGWYHIARLSHMLSPSQTRDQLPAAFGQMRPGDIFQDSPGGQWCYDVSWSHTGFCLISQIFQDTRWSEYWSCALGPCITSWSVQWVYITEGVSVVLIWFGDWDNCCCSPLIKKVRPGPYLV